MEYKPPKHLGLDHDLDHYFLDGTPKFPDADHTKLPLKADTIPKSLDVIRQDKSKLVEEEYGVKEWAQEKINTIKENESLNINTFADPSTVSVERHILSINIFTSNQETTNMTAQMQLLFFAGGIIKFNCINPANPSKFSFELVEKPANLTHLDVSNKVTIGTDDLSIQIDQETRLVLKFNPFSVVILSNKNRSDQVLLQMNSNKSLMFDDNLSADFTFNTEYLYGIPERAYNLLVADTKNDLPYRFFNLDIFGYAAWSKNGIYGCIPIMITRMKDSPSWVSLYWQNASETYTEIHKVNSMSNTFWVSERGNLEAYVFFNNSAAEHFNSISNVVGKAAMPNYFSLGYHQCRYSYNDQQDLLLVNEKFNEYEIPCDTLTLDIDHTDDMRYFTWNYDLFPDPVLMQEILARDNRKLITIADPHIKVDDNYKVYQGAKVKDLCIKDKDGKDFVGECWPGDSVWLDYLNEETRDYWASCYSYENYPHSTPNVFAWNDMNEPSVFEIKDKTLPKDALHTFKSKDDPENTFQVEEREVHNLFGYCMSKATYQGLLRRNQGQNIRPHALSRSFFAGSQKWCAIWTGDTLSSWEHLKISMPMLLALNVCGLSFVGSDVGGFVGDPEPELLVRWYQLGTFMPYFRGHSDKRCKRREPWLYPKKPFELVKNSIKERYKLLPYWYTIFEDHCRNAVPLMRPIWLDLENTDLETVMNEQEKFMLGDALLVHPILDPGVYTLKNSLEGLQGRWYDYYTRKEVQSQEEIDVGVERIGCFVKGGKVVPTFDTRSYMKSTKEVRESNIHLIIGLDENEKSQGRMYFDDGETFNYREGASLTTTVQFSENQLVWETQGQKSYHPGNRVTRAIVMGLKQTHFTKASLELQGGIKQNIQVIKQVGHTVLEFVALADANWKISLY